MYVTSPFDHPEEFFEQYQETVRKYKRMKRWADENPDKMDARRYNKLDAVLKRATWYEYQWDRFENYVKNPRLRKPPKPSGDLQTRGSLVDIKTINIEPLDITLDL